jgi:hypothetical protein
MVTPIEREHDPGAPHIVHSDHYDHRNDNYTAMTINYGKLEAHNHTATPSLFVDPEDLDDRVDAIKNDEGLQFYLFRCLFVNLKLKGELLSIITSRDLDGRKQLIVLSNKREPAIVPNFELEDFPLRFQEVDKAAKLQNDKTTKLFIVPASHKEIKLFSCLPESLAMKYAEPEAEDHELYLTVREFCSERWGVMRDIYLDIVTCYALVSWVREVPPSAGVLVSCGKAGTGKSILIQILEEVGFLAVDLASITGPAIGFVDEVYHPFLLHDECQNLNSAQNPDIAEKIALINSRYKHKAKRVKMGEPARNKARMLEVQRLFGFCALAGLELPASLGIRDRAILLPSMYSNPKKVVDDEDSKRKAALIRARCLAFRSRYLFEDFGQYRGEFDKLLEGCTGRTREISYSILFVAKICAPAGTLEKLVAFFKALDEKKKADTAVSELADVMHAYFELLRTNRQVFISDILSSLNEGRTEQDPDRLSSKDLGRKLATLGFVTRRATTSEKKGRKYVEYDEDLLRAHAATYNVELGLDFFK